VGWYEGRVCQAGHDVVVARACESQHVDIETQKTQPETTSSSRLGFPFCLPKVTLNTADTDLGSSLDYWPKA
jgi:hypothetical protein